MKPYWFLEDPIDLEYKYYVLMAYLMKIKDHFDKPGFEKYFKNILSIKRDLESFIKKTEFSQKTLAKMTEEEKEYFHNLLDKNLDVIGEVEEIAKNSLTTIDEFLEKNEEFYERYNSLVSVESYCSKYNLWDQGFLVIRKKGIKTMRIFTWFFSIVKISQKDNVALLMTEILDPLCESTKDIVKIKKFLKSNIRDFSDQYDCILVSEVSNNIDMEIGTELSKEKSIDLIMNKFKS
jgi:arsenate reductase-like glutaredoxin family protein